MRLENTSGTSVSTPRVLEWEWDKRLLRRMRLMDGPYLLRTGLEPELLWRQYAQLTDVEDAFPVLKSELAIRPIWPAGDTGGRPHHDCVPGIFPVGVPHAEAARRRDIPDRGAIDREALHNPEGRGVVRPAPRWTDLPAADHRAGNGTSPDRAPPRMATTPTTAAENLREGRAGKSMRPPFVWATEALCAELLPCKSRACAISIPRTANSG